MSFLKVKVLKRQLLHDPETGYLIDFLKVGTKLDDVPDNGFWLGKCKEGYLEMQGRIEDEPEEVSIYEGLNVTQLKSLAELHEVDLGNLKKRDKITAMLDEAGISGEDVQEFKEIE